MQENIISLGKEAGQNSSCILVKPFEQANTVEF
jgi:hypothetical protein